MISFVKIYKKMIGGTSKKDFKPLILKIFRKLMEYYEVSNKSVNAFRVLAYRKAIHILEKHKGSIEDLSDLDLGKKSVDKIKIIMETGTLPIYDEICKDKKTNALIMFQKVIGVGPKIAREWLKKGVYTLSDLKKKDIKLTETQKMGIKYYNDLNTRINRQDITKIAKIIEKDIRKINKKLELNIVGSYRMGKETSGDIDLIITYPDREIVGKSGINIHFMDTILEKIDKYIKYTISHGEQKSLLIVKFPKIRKKAMRMDLVCIPHSQFPWYLLYFSSDVTFSRKIRDCASRKGYKLNEKGLFYKLNGQKVKLDVKTEKDIFKFLEIDYIKPEDRLIETLSC